MECRGARSQSLQEQELEEAFVDSRMPGAQRFRINLIGMGVVERSSLPELRPKIPAPAPGFNLGMIQSNPGNCPSFHSHTKKEAFMPLMRPWDATLLEEEGDHYTATIRMR
jgi:hypothetical protein